MIDQMTLQTVGILLTGLTVSIAAIYYTLNLRYTRRNQDLQLETRQAQLFMQIYNQWATMEMGIQWENTLNNEWSYEDYHKYNVEDIVGARMLARFYEGIGVLVKRNLIDIKLVDDLLSGDLMRYWEHIEPFMLEYRKHQNWPQAAEWVEYLYNQIKTIVKDQHPELIT